MKKIISLSLLLFFVSISFAQERTFSLRATLALYSFAGGSAVEKYSDMVVLSFYKDRITIKDTNIKKTNCVYDAQNVEFSPQEKLPGYCSYALFDKINKEHLIITKDGNKMEIECSKTIYDISVLEAHEIDPKTKKPISDKISKDDLMQIFRQLLESYHTEKPKKPSTPPEPKAMHISEFAESYLKGYYKQRNLVFEFDENNELKKETDCLVAWWGTELQLTFTLVNMGLSFSFNADDSRLYEVVGENGNIEYTLTDALIHEMPEDMKGKIHVSLTAFKGDYMLNVINSENGVVTRSYSTILTDKPIIFKPINKDTMIEKTGRAGAEDLRDHFFYHGYKTGKIRNREPEF